MMLVVFELSVIVLAAIGYFYEWPVDVVTFFLGGALGPLVVDFARAVRYGDGESGE